MFYTLKPGGGTRRVVRMDPLRAMVLNRDNFAPREHLAMSRDIFVFHT